MPPDRPLVARRTGLLVARRAGLLVAPVPSPRMPVLPPGEDGWRVSCGSVTGILETAAPGRRRPWWRRVVRFRPALPGGVSLPVAAVGAVTIVLGVMLRFYAPTALWLDETISVNISRLPISQIPTALSHDGAPPLYYVMLHYWMLAFGQGDVSVRALSGVTSVAALPLFWYAGRRVGGRTVAWVTFFLGLTSPFAIYYATSTRMYSLMILWCLLGFLALVRALEAPTRARLVAFAVTVAGTLYTHYWGLYLVAVTGAWLLYQIWRHRRGLPQRVDPVAVRRCVVAMVAGGLLFVPWVPIFVFQTLHTGTPWTTAAGPADMLAVFGDFSGTGPWAVLLAFLYFGLMVLGVFGRRSDVPAEGADGPAGGVVPDDLRAASPPRSTEAVLIAAGLDPAPLRPGRRARLRGWADRAVGFAGFGPGGLGASERRRQPGRGVTLVLQPNGRALPIAGVLVGTLVLAVVAGAVAQAAFVGRYTASVLPLFLLLVALGVGVLGRPRLMGGALAVLCVAGLFTGLGNNGQPRTQAVVVARILNVEARPGDLVVYCPDQLGPAVDRLLTVPAVTELTFPRAIGAQRVDWVNYRAAIDRTNPETFAQDMIARLSPGNTLFLVWNDGYPGLGSSCGNLQSWFALLLGQGAQMVHASRTYYENENLTRYPS
jgi:hypothetical protein